LAEAEAKYKAETKIQAEELSFSASAFVSVLNLVSAGTSLIYVYT